MNVGANDGNVASERADGSKEVSEQDKNTICLDNETGQGPSEEDQEYTSHKSCRSFQFLPSCEEDESLLKTDDEGQANEEENLDGSVSSTITLVDSVRFP